MQRKWSRIAYLSAWANPTRGCDQTVPTTKVLLLSNECAFCKMISRVFCLLVFTFWRWTNKNITLLCNNILGFLSWLEDPVPTFTRTALSVPCHLRIALLWSNFTSSFAELPFPFIGFPKSVSCWAQGMSLWSDHGELCKGTELHYFFFRGWILLRCSPPSLESTLLVPEHQEIKLQPGRVMNIPSPRARSSVTEGLSCVWTCTSPGG